MSTMDNFAYLGESKDTTGFTNNWLNSRDQSHFFEQRYKDFPLYDEPRRPQAQQYSTDDDTLYRDILKGIVERSPLSDAYFSFKNIQQLKVAICNIIAKQSGGKYVITPEAQSTNELVTVMRSIFLQNAKFLPDKIPEQILELNYMVALFVVPRAMSNIQQELSYRRDQSTQPLTMDRPMWTSTSGTKYLPSVTRTFI